MKFGIRVLAAAAIVVCVRGASAQTVRTAAPPTADELPAKKTPAIPRPARARKAFTPARTPWGDPEIAGVFTNNDESGIPFERPAQFEGRTRQDVTPAELAEIVKQRQQQTIERAPTLSEFPGATSP